MKIGDEFEVEGRRFKIFRDNLHDNICVKQIEGKSELEKLAATYAEKISKVCPYPIIDHIFIDGALALLEYAEKCLKDSKLDQIDIYDLRKWCGKSNVFLY